MGMGLFSSWSEVEALVSGFESQSLLGEHDWTHRDHLAAAAFYCLTSPDHAEGRMRSGIQLLNRARGVQQTAGGGYHETLTVVWTRLIRSHIEALHEADPLSKVNSVLMRFEDRRAPLDYYSRDVLMSTAARYGWVEPDLRMLP